VPTRDRVEARSDLVQGRVPDSCNELLEKIDTTVCTDPSREAFVEDMAAGMRAIFPKIQSATVNTGTFDMLCTADLKHFARNCAGRK
jgi:hypothetical protein